MVRGLCGSVNETVVLDAVAPTRGTDNVVCPPPGKVDCAASTAEITLDAVLSSVCR